MDGVPKKIKADKRIVLQMENGISILLTEVHGTDTFELRYFYEEGGSSLVARGDAYDAMDMPFIGVNPDHDWVKYD